MQGQGQCQYLKNIQYMSQCVARRGVPEHQLPIDRETGMRGKYTPVSRRLQIADLQLAPYDLNEASTLRGRQHSGQVRHSQVRQRQELLSRCQLSFKRVIPVMAQRRTGLSDYTVANQRQPDTRHVLSREQAIRVYDRQVKCADQTNILRFFLTVKSAYTIPRCAEQELPSRTAAVCTEVKVPYAASAAQIACSCHNLSPADIHPIQFCRPCHKGFTSGC